MKVMKEIQLIKRLLRDIMDSSKKLVTDGEKTKNFIEIEKRKSQ